MDPRRLLPTLAVLAAVCVLATVALTLVRHAPDNARDPAARERASGSISGDAPASTEPSAILSAWDEQRSSAWAAGDVKALRDLYVTGSQAGERDARLLQRYLDRGLRVEDLRMQVLSLRVIDRSSSRLRLLVTDRVVGARAVGRGNAVQLPTDRASTRRIVLVKVKSQWLVEEVRDQASAAASTSRTSSSSKS